MTSAETGALLQRWFDEVWNQGKESTIHELFDKNGKAHGWPEPTSVLRGPKEFAKVFHQFRSAFSEIKITIHEIIAEGGHGAVRWTCTSKHTGDGLGFAGTNKPVTLPGSSFILCKNGKLLEGWNFLDQTSVIHQLRIAADKNAAAGKQRSAGISKPVAPIRKKSGRSLK
ncbi:ester cyclase [Terriglobus albidus]|nr:ester cyclase [Terriglobus albidus]